MAEETDPPAPPSPWRIKLKFLGIGLLVGGLAGGIGAGKIYLDKRAEVAAMQERMENLESRQGLFEAHAAVSSASIELRRDNFGDAKNRASTAWSRLDAVDPDAANIEADVLQTIKDRLDGIDIAASGDTEGASSALDDVALALDRLINPVP